MSATRERLTFELEALLKKRNEAAFVLREATDADLQS